MMKTGLIFVLLQIIFALSSAQQNIKFQIDMNSPVKEGLFDASKGDSVIVRGSFNNWQGNDYVLRGRSQEQKYTATFTIAGDSGRVIEYKFLILKANGRVLWEKNPNVENPPHGNRILVLNGKDQELLWAKFDFDKYYLAAGGKKVIFTVEELKQDFERFRQTLEREHCCLYEYTPKKTFDSLFQKQSRLIDKPLHPHEFYKILTPVTAKIGCMHTGVWMPGGYWDMEPGNLFPLQIKLIQDYAVVSGSYIDTVQVPVGSIILKINDRSIYDIIKELRDNLSEDAFNENFINCQIEKRFPMIYARRFGFPEKYRVTYALPGRKTRKTDVLLPADIQSVREIVFANFQHPDLSFELKDDINTAIITVKTFGYYDRVEYFKQFMDSSFQEIKQKKISNLILDLRGNDGGDPFCAVILFSYLEPEPLPYFAEPYGKYSELAKPIPRAENHFTANLFTLLDGHCASTNGHFSSLLKYHQIGKFVGTASGATYKCNAGKNTEVHLKNAGIILNFGRNTYAAAVQGMDKTKPIMPDYPVTQTYRDFLDDRDVFLETALELINNQSKPVK
jgi:hypothetical protein